MTIVVTMRLLFGGNKTNDRYRVVTLAIAKQRLKAVRGFVNNERLKARKKFEVRKRAVYKIRSLRRAP